MFLVNGEWSSVISIADRSFQYGDGCFTTMLTQKDRILHWIEHMERMNSCLDVLNIPRPDWKQVEKWLEQVNTGEDKGGLKLLITRGEGGRGYSPSQVGKPNIVISRFEFPLHYQNWAQVGIELGVCQTPLGHNPLLAGYKHNNRLEQVLLKSEMERQAKVDGVASILMVMLSRQRWRIYFGLQITLCIHPCLIEPESMVLSGVKYSIGH